MADAEPAARFGAALRSEFLLEADLCYLNHGAFGATPREVLDSQAEWRRRMERNPTKFFQEIQVFQEIQGGPALLRVAARAAARMLGGRSEDWAFVDNATAGINAVLASLPLAPGDEVLTTSLAYGAVRNTLRHHAGRAGATVVEAPVAVPIESADRVLAAVERAITRKTRIAVLDHVTSATAAVLPLGPLVRLCRAAGVPVLIDGAHAPGMLALDVPGLGVDWYVGNAHKWLFAPRGCGLIWCAPERQAALHPPVISHFLDQGFAAEFGWTGTRDVSAWLALPAAVAFAEGHGMAAVQQHNAALARAAAALLAEAWKVPLAAPADMLGAMATLRLPIAARADLETGRALQRQLREKHRIEAPILPIAGALWLRISAQIYNEPDDYTRLAEAVPRL